MGHSIDKETKHVTKTSKTKGTRNDARRAIKGGLNLQGDQGEEGKAKRKLSAIDAQPGLAGSAPMNARR
jgi:hypothetical protein